jgi:hypothetical protein
MIAQEQFSKYPVWLQKTWSFLTKLKMPSKLVFFGISILASLWFLVRVLPKPSRAAYPCMQVAAPLMSGFFVWLLAFGGAAFAFKKTKRYFIQSRYLTAVLFLAFAIGCFGLLAVKSALQSQAKNIEVWYKPNVPEGIARGINPGRVAWGHNPRIASWDGTTGFWWDDKYNNQGETDKLFKQTLFSLTGKKNEVQAWDALFRFFNKTKGRQDAGYASGEKITIKINQNNTKEHKSCNEINANPQLVLSLLQSLIEQAEIPQQNITVADPSRFITDNIFDKCIAVYPKVHFVDHDGGDGREKSIFIENAIPYSVDNGGVAKNLAACIVNADYIINMALMKGHVSQGATLCAKNYFGCTSIETDWRKNSHSSGFSQNRDGSYKYSVYTDYMGHKDLGEKTMLFLIDGIYSNKFVDRTPAFKWMMPPFNNQWPSSLFASQDGVAIDAVVLDFILNEWPDAPDLMYSDYYLLESAKAGNPPSGTIYDPEKDGSVLKSLGVTEHWNNATDKKYSRNLARGNGIELVYSLVK